MKKEIILNKTQLDTISVNFPSLIERDEQDNLTLNIEALTTMLTGETYDAAMLLLSMNNKDNLISKDNEILVLNQKIWALEGEIKDMVLEDECNKHTMKQIQKLNLRFGR